LPADLGKVEVLGYDAVRDYRITRRAVGLVPQEINFDPFFTVEETLVFPGRLLRDPSVRGAAGGAALRPGPPRQAPRQHPRASGGMKRRLLIAKALVHRPPVAVPRRATAGVDVEAAPGSLDLPCAS